MKLKWNEFKTNPPEKDGQYLVIRKDKNRYILWFTNDINKARGLSFPSGTLGWYSFDIDGYYFEIYDVIMWAELPEMPF